VVRERDAIVVSLDGALAYNAARTDPDAFVRQFPGLLVILRLQTGCKASPTPWSRG